MNCCVPPGARIADDGDIDEAPIATVALADFVGSATLVAVTVFVPGCEGAVYMPAALIVPGAEFAPAATDQVTAVFLVFLTVAANCVVAPAATLIDA